MKNVVITGFGINSCIGNTYKYVLGSFIVRIIYFKIENFKKLFDTK